VGVGGIARGEDAAQYLWAGASPRAGGDRLLLGPPLRGGLRLLAVTALTSLSAGELAEAWGRGEVDPRTEVLRLAGMAMDAGAAGVVASALEARSPPGLLGPERAIVTPGIRLARDPHHDQVRVAFPAAP
jgi:orotidine-5'-phosphate decarboxylase